MASNLPAEQKTNWVSNEYVMPVDTNGWGEAFNLLTKAIPIYAGNGNFYTVSSFSSNVINLSPITFSNNTENQTPDSYINGMSVWFLATFNNTTSTSVNVDGLGTVPIYQINNTVLTANKIKSGYFIHLIYNAQNNRFYLVSADVLPEMVGHADQFLSTNGTIPFWSDVPSPVEIVYET